MISSVKSAIDVSWVMLIFEILLWSLFNFLMLVVVVNFVPASVVVSLLVQNLIRHSANSSVGYFLSWASC